MEAKIVVVCDSTRVIVFEGSGLHIPIGRHVVVYAATPETIREAVDISTGIERQRVEGEGIEPIWDEEIAMDVGPADLYR